MDAILCSWESAGKGILSPDFIHTTLLVQN